MQIRTRVRSHDGERGATMVEAAVVLPFLLMVVFGMIDLAFAFNEQAEVDNATRSAARVAASLPKQGPQALEVAAVDALNAVADDLTSGVPSEAWVFQAVDAGGGDFEAPAVCAANCVVAAWNPAARRFDPPAGDFFTAIEQNACAGASSRIGVTVKVDHEWLVGYLPFHDGGAEIDSTTIMALEPSANPAKCPVGLA